MIWYIVAFLFLTAFIVEYAFFKATGYIDLTIFYNPQVLSSLVFFYRKEVGLYGIFVVLMFLVIYFYQENKIKKRKNCALQEVDLADIAKIWLEAEEYKQAVRAEFSQPTKTNKEEVKIIIPNFQKERSKKLFEYINEKREYFGEKGIEIIKNLIELLEKNPASSVASWFKNDSNTKDYKDLVVGNKTSYDILSEYSLYEHTMDVVEEIIEIVEQKEEAGLYFERAIIAALAHDIGKLKSIQNYSNKITSELFRTAPHNVISALFLREKYPDFSKEVIEAVEFHHGAVKPKNNYILEMLIKADKKAREKEIQKWLINNKINKNKEDKKVEKLPEEKPEEKQSRIEIQEKENDIPEDDIFDLDMEDIFGDEEDEVFDLKRILEEEPCKIKKTIRGVDLEELLFVNGGYLYISLPYANKLGLNEKPGKFKVSFQDSEYELLLVKIKPDFLGNYECEGVSVEEIE